MTERKTVRKKRETLAAEKPIPVIPGQKDLFEVLPTEGAVVRAEAVSPAAADLLLVTPPKPRRAASDGERKHLTALEVDRLLMAAKANPRTGLRDRCLIFLMFRHGLRVTEACAMRIAQVDLESKILQVQRLKGGLSTTQPLRTEEIRLLKSWMAERERWLRKWRKKDSTGGTLDSQALFLSTRGTALSRKTFWTLLRRYGEVAGLALPPHPHMLRHACGFALADQGADTRLIQDYLGHRNIQHTVRYTATNPLRFEKLWR